MSVAMNKIINIDIPEKIFVTWQEIVNHLARIYEVPSALIMRAHEFKIEVFVSSQSKDNPYKKGETAEYNGLYCQHVMETNDMLLVPNALDDPKWDHNPDIKLNMLSYLGFPIRWPNGEMFGTICVLDTKRNEFSESLIQFLKSLGNMIEHVLEMVFHNANKNPAQLQFDEKPIILPICSFCKKIRINEVTWQKLEDYFSLHYNFRFTHGICQNCFETHIKNP
jgi:transcriptional regulator with GAF, ATPase, and Fis domain